MGKRKDGIGAVKLSKSAILGFSCLLGFCVFGGVAAASDGDLPGLSNVKLGMTEDEVKSLFAPVPATVTRYQNAQGGQPYSVMEVETYRVEGYKFSGRFIFGEYSAGLNRIVLSHVSTDAATCYVNISRLFEGRYGASKTADRSENMISVSEGRMWSADHVRIRTSYAAMSAVKEGSCNLTYDGSPDK